MLIFFFFCLILAKGGRISRRHWLSDIFIFERNWGASGVYVFDRAAAERGGKKQIRCAAKRYGVSSLDCRRNTPANTRFIRFVTDKVSMLKQEIGQSIDIQLNAPWTPQYCKKYGIRKLGNLDAVQASNNGFLPNNLHIPYASWTDASQGVQNIHITQANGQFNIKFFKPT